MSAVSPWWFRGYRCEALLGVIGIRDIWVKNHRDTGYLGRKLKGYGIFKKDSWTSKIEDLIFWKNKISLLVNIEGANSEKKKQKQKLSNAIFYILLSSIVNIDNRCQYRLLSENNSPPPPRLFPFRATFARSDLTLGSCDCFFITCGHFDHGCRASSMQRTAEGTKYQWNSKDRNAPITAGENHPITAEHNAS